MKAKKDDRVLTIKFNADTAATMQWNFKPQQAEVKLYAGETALAFYTARNPTPKPIDGISTYNVVPFEAGQVSHFKRSHFLFIRLFLLVFCSTSTKSSAFALKNSD